jgi:hypothetical protein
MMGEGEADAAASPVISMGGGAFPIVFSFSSTMGKRCYPINPGCRQQQ